jgi:hypothetical protein
MNGRTSREWLVPLTGVLFLALLIASFIVGGEPKDADHSPDEIAQWYLDNKDSAQIAAFIGTVAGAVLIFFAAYLRKVLAAAEGAGAMLPILVLIGLSIVAVGGAIDGTILFATAEAADDIEPTSVQTLQALWDNDFIPLAVGIALFLVSVGISILRTDVLPKWLGWVTLVLALVSLTPAGFFAFPGTGLLILVLSVWLAIRARRAAAPPAAPPPAPAAQ